VKSQPGSTVVDISTVYAGQLGKAQRGVALLPDRSVRVQDEFTTLAKSATVRWAMVTFADMHIDGAGRAILRQEGKQLSFQVLEPAGARLEIYPTDPPPAPTDAANPGTRLLGFELKVPTGTAQRIVVQLIPGSGPPSEIPIRPLTQW
jgi:hypothetical protein